MSFLQALAEVTPSSVEGWGAFVGVVGVPAGVLFYVLREIRPEIVQLRQTVTLLTIVVARMSGQDVDQIKKDYLGGGQ
jgi:hypothetical protein